MRNPYDAIGRIGILLAIVGAVNWLLVGIFQWNLVKWIFTQSGTQTVGSTGERIVYVVVGVGGLLAIPMLAATLARASRRTVRSDESYVGDRAAYDRGAPNEVRAEQSTPVRKTERVIIRTEEPITGSGVAGSGEATTSVDQSQRYGTVEEADDEYGTSAEDSRAA